MSERMRGAGHEELDTAALKELVRLQPKVSLDDPRVDMQNGPAVHTQYRANFYVRFIELQAMQKGVASDSQITYIRMVKERFGIDLVDFYARNVQLCDAICDAIAEKEPYDRIMLAYGDMVAREAYGELPPGAADELVTAAEHPLGIEAIGMYYWDRINPLLERAYASLETTTLNAPFLTQ